MRDERLLERVQVVTVCRHPVNSDDLGVRMRDGERQAAVDPPPVEQDGAGTALPVVTALLRAGEALALAQCVQQGGPGVDGQMVCRSIDPEGDPNVHGLACLLLVALLLGNWLSAFTRKQNLRDWLHGLCISPVPLQLSQQPDHPRGVCAVLNDAIEPRPVLLYVRASNTIHHSLYPLPPPHPFHPTQRT